MRIFIAAAASLMLAACATAVGTNYQPADQKGYGYTEQRVEGDRFRIMFRGDGATPPEAVEDYALLRAAELAVENGYDWFRVISRSLDRQNKGGVGLGAGFGAGSYGGNTAVGGGVSGDLGTVGSKPFYTARLEVLMGKGQRPEGNDVYDARAVIQSIRSKTAPSGGA